MKDSLQLVLICIAVVALAFVAEHVAPLMALTLYLKQHPQPYTALCIGISAAGWAMLVVVWLWGLVQSGRPMSEAEARAFASRSAGQPHIARRLSGLVVGRTFHEKTGFAAIKQAVRDGTWRRDPHYARFVIGIVALSLVTIGMFGYFFVIGPPVVKLICAGVVLYAHARVALGFMKA